jgi:hypothetical protein
VRYQAGEWRRVDADRDGHACGVMDECWAHHTRVAPTRHSETRPFRAELEFDFVPLKIVIWLARLALALALVLAPLGT